MLKNKLTDWPDSSYMIEGFGGFTQDVSATLQDQWDRVAGGELAMSPQLKNYFNKIGFFLAL